MFKCIVCGAESAERWQLFNSPDGRIDFCGYACRRFFASGVAVPTLDARMSFELSVLEGGRARTRERPGRCDTALTR